MRVKKLRMLYLIKILVKMYILREHLLNCLENIVLKLLNKMLVRERETQIYSFIYRNFHNLFQNI